MNVLITGATGYIGGAVAEALSAAGHAVHGVARRAESLDRIRDRGWRAVPGDLRDLRWLASSVSGFEAVVHAANTGGEDAARVDMEATRAFLRVLDRSGKAFVYTSGAWVLGPGVSDETSPVAPPELVAWRAPLEAEVLGAAPGIRSVVLRPGVVYGGGGGIPGMVARGELPVVGDGGQRWPLVHIEDLADLYVRALHAPAGSVLHGVSTSLTMRELALLGAAGRRAVEVLALEAARGRFGPFADALALDQSVASMRTQDALGWRPVGPSPIEDLLAGSRSAAGRGRMAVA